MPKIEPLLNPVMVVFPAPVRMTESGQLLADVGDSFGRIVGVIVHIDDRRQIRVECAAGRRLRRRPLSAADNGQ